MSGKNIPVEGDCDICGQSISQSELSRNYHRESGILTCDGCVNLYQTKHKHFED